MATAAVIPVTNSEEDKFSANKPVSIHRHELTNDDIRQMIERLENNIRLQKAERQRLQLEAQKTERRINANKDKVEQNKQRPYLHSKVTEMFDDGSVVLQTSNRQTIYLPNSGLVDITSLQPNDIVGVNQDSYVILEQLPTDYDPRIQSMPVIQDKKPQTTFSDIGGLDREIEQLIEAIILPFEHQEKFSQIGIQPCKGVLLYGKPGTGKTSLARACANRLNAHFIRLCSTEIVSKYIGDGADIVRNVFKLAREKAPTVIFIDEIDAIGMSRSSGSDNRAVNQVLIQLLNELDGFCRDDHCKIKVIAATNRADMLDPALLRSGRLDRKIKCGLPNEKQRESILKIHANKFKFKYAKDVNFKQLAQCTNGMNGAQLKACTVEAAMNVLRGNNEILTHQDFVNGIAVVQDKKKFLFQYYR